MAAPFAELSDVAAGSPGLVRGVIGLVGALLALAGARVYKAGLLLASFGVGAVGALWLFSEASAWIPSLGTPDVLAVAALIGGVALAGVAAVVHRLALVAVGALAGASVAGAVAHLAVAHTPWWAPVVGSVVGSIALPFAFPALLRVLTPAVGAVLVAWAVGRPENPWILLAVFVVGCVVQLGLVRGKDEGEDE